MCQSLNWSCSLLLLLFSSSTVLICGQNYKLETEDAIIVEALDSAEFLRSKRQLWQTSGSSSTENPPGWPQEAVNNCISPEGRYGICVTRSVCHWIQQSFGQMTNELDDSLTVCTVPRGEDVRAQLADFIGVCCPGIESPPPGPTNFPVSLSSDQSASTSVEQEGTSRASRPWQTSTTPRQPPAVTHWWQRPSVTTTKPPEPSTTAWWQTTKPTAAVTQWWQTTRRPTPTRPWWETSSTSTTGSTAWWQTTTKATTARQQEESGPDEDEDTDEYYSCGLRNFESDRIVGGVEANKGEFPWIAGLYKRGRHFCGGSLIDETHVLTAAHCVAHMSSYDVAQLRVRVGDHDKSTPFESKHQTLKVARIVRHKGFSTETLHDDVALVTLASRVKFANNIRAICLARGSSNYEGRVVTVAGWGSLREGGRQPNVLMKVSIKVWKNSDCSATYGRQAPGGIISSMMCAGRKGKDSCSGDSGGPLMVVEGGVVYQVGVVSWGIGCGKARYPGVYTRVTSLIDWIERNRKNY